jgi:hypothetical protein
VILLAHLVSGFKLGFCLFEAEGCQYFNPVKVRGVSACCGAVEVPCVCSMAAGEVLSVYWFARFEQAKAWTMHH